MSDDLCVKEIPQYYYVNDNGEFWSNKIGWVDVLEATPFTKEKIEEHIRRNRAPFETVMVVKVSVEMHFSTENKRKSKSY